MNKINLDELFEKKRNVYLNRLKIYDKILARIHKKIKVTARQQYNDPWCFCIIPEFIIGIPKYNTASCISYIMESLKENGFIIKYTHPNLLFVSWNHYIPNYKRVDIKKKTGLTIDGFGNIIKQQESKQISKKNLVTTITKKTFKPITNYKPIGIYNSNIIKKINAKLS